MICTDRIEEIISGVLGDPKRSYAGSGGWYEYNCPKCAEENGSPDGKFNLAVNVEQLYCHCWKCSYSGKLLRLVKRYGTSDSLSEYKTEVSSMRERLKYSLLTESVCELDDCMEDFSLKLPDGFRPIGDDSESLQAKKYMQSRGIGPEIIDFFSIGYIGNEYRKDYSMKNRIVLQSHNEYGELNFWVGRDYTGASKVKYKNVNVEKKDIVFDEDKINWYEPVTLVEGPFDHIVVPNSIPLLGKSIGPDYAVAKAVIEKSKSFVNIFLDDDAYSSAIKAYKFLNSTQLHGRVRVVECPSGTDAADIYRERGYKGMLKVLRTAKEINELDLIKL